jgi:hypothetical protein
MEPKELQAAISSELGSSEVTPRNLLCALRRLSERCVSSLLTGQCLLHIRWLVTL